VTPNFPHSAPNGYSYSVEKFNSKFDRIMLNHHCKYDYNLGKAVATVWGFYSIKKQLYFAPVNSKTPGKQIDLSLTTPYTGMFPPKKCNLEKFFV